jgi:hypothetical protein
MAEQKPGVELNRALMEKAETLDDGQIGVQTTDRR